ncbi:Ig-like domain-containing protein [Corallococcus interemptor]|nr:Ig-like domain-containing protein [Corallococcus interemptor]
MPNLKHLLLLGCIGLSPACIDVPPLVEEPPKQDAGAPDADFTFTAVPLQEQVLPGGTLDCDIQLTWTDTTGGAVTWSLLSPPAGIELQSFTLPRGETRGTLSIRVGAGTVPGPYTLTLQGKNGTVTKQATVAVTVGKPGDLVVNWVVPTPGKAYTRGPLLLQFTVEGGAAEQAEILKDTTVLVKPTGSPYSFTWDTTSEAEGTYQLSIRATRGGAAFISAPRTVIVDRTAPTVASFLPARDAATVGVHDAIQVTFSEPMNPNSVTESAVGLKTGTGAAIAKSVALSADGKTLTVTPLSALAAPSTVQVDFTAAASALTDLAGNGVVAAPAWSFSVPTWLPLGGAVSATGGATSAESVILKLDHNDRPILAWVESDGTNKNVYVSRWSGETWTMLGAPLNGLTALGTDAANPTLAIDAYGEPVVAWDEATGSSYDSTIFIRRWTGMKWESVPSPTPPSALDRLFEPSLSIGPDNTLSLTVSRYDTASTSILHYRSLQQTPYWQQPWTLSKAPYLHNPGNATSTTSGGDVFIASEIYNDHTEHHSITVHKNEDPYLGSMALGQDANTPSIGVDSNGRPWVAWEEFEATPQSDWKIHWARWEGASWTNPAAIRTRSTGNTSPSIALAKGGPHVLAWSGIVDSERSIMVSQWISSSWQTMDSPLNALTAAGTPATGPSATLNSEALPFIAWTEADAISASIYVVRFNR